MQRFFAFQSFLGIITAVLLTACGGGGGGPAHVMISSNAPANGMTGVVYPPFTFSASGGSGTYAWTETGALPPGLTLSAAGQLSGTPVTAGSYPFTVTATDSSNPQLTASAAFSFKIADSMISVAPASPPAGTVTYPYPGFTFSVASGGSPPFTWTVTRGNLPPGLTLGGDGSLSGTPTSVGSATFTVTATDSAVPAATGSHQFSVGINNPGAPVITQTPPPPTGTVGVVYPAFTFTASGGLAPLIWSETGTLPSGLGFSVNGVLSGIPSATGIFPITVSVKDALNQSAPALSFTVRVSPASSGTFTPTVGNMSLARYGHTATLLLSGQVLVAGGSTVLSPVVAETSVELYDPTSEKFIATGEMKFARYRHTATLLADAALPNSGKVLMVGGGTQTAELYDPASGTFTQTGKSLVLRSGQTATLLKTGKVLVAGGGTAAAELYDPSSGVFTATGTMASARTAATATLLVSGEVLIAGGGTATAELYDPTSGLFTATGTMSEVRSGHTATLLTDGSVLIVGPDVTAELYNPATGVFAPVGNLPIQPDAYIGGTAGITGSTATLLQDGAVLVAGGRIVGHYPAVLSLASAELYASQSEGFTFTASLNTARDGHTATLLANGTILVTGGINHSLLYGGLRPFEVASVLSSAELFK